MLRPCWWVAVQGIWAIQRAGSSVAFLTGKQGKKGSQALPFTGKRGCDRVCLQHGDEVQEEGLVQAGRQALRGVAGRLEASGKRR